MRVRKGDTVRVISGNDKGQVGKVLKTFPKSNRIIVEGVHLIKRHTRPTQKNRKGGIIEKEGEISASNVMFFDLRTNAPARIGYRKLTDGTKVRINKKSGEIIE
ncbi:MAG: 50S ribosomal protein L24 [candidate division Zixibacteria bacterium 4484_95]|nr:MAG: 50S ribosomal protein L24 [candidate division Zixibacteria bacterium 4484_95]